MANERYYCGLVTKFDIHLSKISNVYPRGVNEISERKQREGISSYLPLFKWHFETHTHTLQSFTYIHMLTHYFPLGRQKRKIYFHDPGTSLSPRSNWVLNFVWGKCCFNRIAWNLARGHRTYRRFFWKATLKEELNYVWGNIFTGE